MTQLLTPQTGKKEKASWSKTGFKRTNGSTGIILNLQHRKWLVTIRRLVIQKVTHKSQEVHKACLSHRVWRDIIVRLLIVKWTRTAVTYSRLQNLDKIWGQYLKEHRLSTYYKVIIYSRPLNRHCQQHKGSDRPTDQRTIYKPSWGNQCPASCQANASAEFAHFGKVFLFQHTIYSGLNHTEERRGKYSNRKKKKLRQTCTTHIEYMQNIMRHVWLDVLI